MARSRRFPNVSELKKTLTPSMPWAERESLTKDATVNLRVSSVEKAEMVRFAAAFGKTLSEYLIALHRVAVAIQGKPPGRDVRQASRVKPS